MVPVDYFKVVKFLIFIWTTSFIVLQKTNAQPVSDSSDSSLDSSYFFYQQSEYPRDCQEVYEHCSSTNSSGIYYIKPDGYQEAFEVYCDITDDLARWTVIQRRSFDGIIGFNRDWNGYRNGFGFLSHDFWIGNERLSYLTNQKKYKLLIEMTLADDSAVTVFYNNFRIGDVFSQYKLFGATQVFGATGGISWCPFNMVYGNCTCGQRLCRDPRVCRNTCTEGRFEGCICPDGFYMESGGCIPERDCGCYLSEEFDVIPEGETHFNTDCTRVAVCSDGQLMLERYECSPNAVCEERSGERKCYCNEGFSGDGEICTSIIRTDCMDVYNAGHENSGVYSITPTNWPGSAFDVYCNMTDGGGWTVFQRRIDGDVDFYLGWDRYKQGFGEVDDEHWLGNEQLYYLTNQGNYQLRVDLVNRNGAPYYAKFASFQINNEADNYRLSLVGSYSGTADERSSPNGFALTSHRGSQFSTKDRDNDRLSSDCAVGFHGAWWYGAGSYCVYTNLNGDYDAARDSHASIRWVWLPGSWYNIKYTEMKIRPV